MYIISPDDESWPVYELFRQWPLVLLREGAFDNMGASWEGSHSGLVRAPAKRLACESGLMGSNPIPSAMGTMLIPLV